MFCSRTRDQESADGECTPRKRLLGDRRTGPAERVMPDRRDHRNHLSIASVGTPHSSCLDTLSLLYA
jgi:hypothetical protein